MKRPAPRSKAQLKAGLNRALAALTVPVQLPPPAESEGAAVVRLADEVLAAVNIGHATPHYERADLSLALRFGNTVPPSHCVTYWVASIGRTERIGDSAEEALTVLRDAIQNFKRHNRTEV